MIGNKTANEWFAEYGASHKNKTNKFIHWIAVPIIFLTIAGLFWGIPIPSFISESLPWFNFGIGMLIFSFLFYVKFSASLSVGLGIFCLACYFILYLYSHSSLNDSVSVWLMSLIVFIIAWIFQFIGHKLEGAKPSFFKDILFLMVGPAFFMGYIYRRIGIKY